MNDDLMKDFLLEAFPNPERKGCPDENTLKVLAEERFPVDSAVRLHIGSCSECYAEYRNFRLDWEEARTAGRIVPTTHSASAPQARKRRMPVQIHPLWAIAASLLLAIGVYIVFGHYRSSSVTSAQVTVVAPMDATVDLFNVGTLRGPAEDALPLQEVSLPAAIVHLRVVLPRFSDSGRYTVNVSTDRTGKQLVASGLGEAVASDGKASLNVTLDLRDTKSGAYFLSTVRGTDNGTYYYPLRVK